MKTEIQQSRSGQEMQQGHKEPHAESVEIYRPRRWPASLIFGVAGLVALGGFGWILWAAASAEIADPMKFITEGCLALFLVVVAIAQVGLYWSQKGLMNAQWNVMERQWKAMQCQLGIMREGVDDAKRALEIGERSYVGIQNIKWDRPKLEGAIPDTVLIDIGNSGNVPADSVKVTLEIILDVLREFVPSVAPKCDWHFHGEFDYGSSKLFKGNLPIQVPYKLTRRCGDHVLPIEAIDLIMRQKAFIAVCGHIEYRDEFGHKTTEFRLNYMGGDVWAHGAPELWMFHIKEQRDQNAKQTRKPN